MKAIDGDLSFQSGTTDAFNGQVTVGAGRFIDFSSGFSIGSTGLVSLNGAANSPATLAGGIIFLNSGGILRVSDRADVGNTLTLSGGIVETQTASSELRLNGTTFLNSSRVVGLGTVRQNGNVAVINDTVIEVDTYDLDGLSGNTVVTIEAGNTLDIDSNSIDTGSANDFDGTIVVESGTLDVRTSWLLDGTINLNQTDTAAPVLTGDGILTVRPLGQLNISGAGEIGQQVIIEGGLFSDGDADFNGTTSFTSTAMVETNGPGDAINLNGITTMRRRQLRWWWRDHFQQPRFYHKEHFDRHGRDRPRRCFR